jgi:hypothetical protein
MMKFVALWIVLSIVAIAFFILLEQRRLPRRYAKWKCPQCGRPFGLQPIRIWSVKIYGPGPHGHHGPLLSCSHCRCDFRLDSRGRLSDHASEPITPIKTPESARASAIPRADER